MNDDDAPPFEMDFWHDFDSMEEPPPDSSRVLFEEELTLFETYFAIARACSDRARTICAVARPSIDPQLSIDFNCGRPGHPMDDEGFSFPSYDNDSTDRTIAAQVRRLKAVAVVFAALTLESFINSYMSNSLEAGLVNLLDRQPILRKWGEIVTFICKGELPTGGSAYQAVQTLFKHRNTLVHAKPTTVYHFSDGQSDRNAIDEALGIDPIVLVRRALKGLKEIDPSIDIEWIARKRRRQSWEHFL
jgi:hypothetical protein